MIIQLATVSHNSEPSDYWDDLDEDKFDVGARTKEIATKEFDSLQDCWEECGQKDVIVSKTNIYKEELRPDYIDAVVKVYDARNE